jgi:hypothetical protein
MALTQAELKNVGCSEPFCEHDHSVLFLHPRCHLKAGTEVSYDKRTGQLTIVCGRCKQHVATIAVAAGSLQ